MSKTGWLRLATIGVALVVLAMVVSFLVIADKENFGFLVGSAFLGVITSGVIVGGILLAISAWKLPERKSWRGIALIVWGLIAVTSPAFGFMFLLPWGVLALSLPVVIVALVQLRRPAA
ncbi:MAG TPA: hypothetical protein VF432_15210 [Thermoanaerobaculia bacterium]